jgi:serine/alanine adding enzyme
MIIRYLETQDHKVWDDYILNNPFATHCHLFGWKDIIEEAYNLKSFYLIAQTNSKIVGVLPLFRIKSIIFGDQIVSMPYLNYGGILADDTLSNKLLLDKALYISKESNVNNLELRHTSAINERVLYNKTYSVKDNKVRMVLQLPESGLLLFKSFKSKLRSQINRPIREGMTFKLGGDELLKDFYKVFSKNMRDLGSPVHSQKFFSLIFKYLGEISKIGIVYHNDIPVASGIILLFRDTIEIPWASSIKEYNRFSPNMLLYWSFLEYASNEGFKFFDFGRSTVDSGTYRFKQQWGTKSETLFWYKFYQRKFTKQFAYDKDGSIIEDASIFLWKHLPLKLANHFGPKIRSSISL